MIFSDHNLANSISKFAYPGCVDSIKSSKWARKIPSSNSIRFCCKVINPNLSTFLDSLLWSLWSPFPRQNFHPRWFAHLQPPFSSSPSQYSVSSSWASLPISVSPGLLSPASRSPPSQTVAAPETRDAWRGNRGPPGRALRTPAVSPCSRTAHLERSTTDPAISAAAGTTSSRNKTKTDPSIRPKPKTPEKLQTLPKTRESNTYKASN